MNYKIMGRFVGKILMVEAVFMVPALFIALARGEGDAVRGFFFEYTGDCSAGRNFASAGKKIQ